MSIDSYGDLFLKNKTIYRRTMIVGGFQAAFFGLLTLRLMYLQIWEYRKYLSLSNFNRYRINFVTATRGKIIDKNDIPIAYSRISYRAVFYPSVIKNKEETIRNFFILINQKNINVDKFVKDQMRRIKIYNSYTPLVLDNDLTYDEIARIEFNTEYMPGVWVEKSTTRMYPFKEHLANITGYISKPTPAQMANTDQMDRRLYKDNSFKVGQIGIESIKENELRGRFGIVLKEVNAGGEMLSQINHLQAQDGLNIKLTIDTRLQQYISEMLNGIAGSIIVSDIENGDILAMQSSPCFDPNDMLKGVSDELWKKLNDTKLGYMSNKAIYGTYQPGSTFKPIPVIAALQAGFDPDRVIDCNGEYQYGNRVFHCHKAGGHGKLNMVEALACSCNVYFYEIGNFINPDKLANLSRQFGFDKYINLGIGKESKGLIPDTEWKRKILHQKWIPSETMMFAIGQTYANATLMQLNNMIVSIASGFFIKNRIFFDNKIEDKIDLNIPQEYLDIVRKGCRMAFTHSQGTSRSGSEYQQKYEMAGKTGTAQVISQRFTMAEMYSGKVPKHKMPHGLYVGYAPYSKPKFAVTAMIENGMSGVFALRYAEKAIAKAMDLQKSDI